MTEHFREILNRPPPEDAADIPEAADDLNINTKVPEKEEIMNAMKSLKNGKALQDTTTSTQSSSKADPEVAATILQPLFCSYMEVRLS